MTSDTTVRGGLFNMACTIELGPTHPVGSPPHVEDVAFSRAGARHLGTVNPQRFWDMLWSQSKRSLAEIFGSELRGRGYLSAATDMNRGKASLGVARPISTPELAITGRDNRSRVRIFIQTEDFSSLDLAVTDLRLYTQDGATPDRSMVDEIGERLKRRVPALLSVGLTSPFAGVSGTSPLHWLQVNNIHLADNPCWQLAGSPQAAFRVAMSGSELAAARRATDSDPDDLPF